MSLAQLLTPHIQKAIETIYQISFDKIEFQATRKDFEGDITWVIFPLLKQVKANPADIGTKIGTYLVEQTSLIEKFNVIQGFLNLVVTDDFYLNLFSEIHQNDNFGFQPVDENSKTIMVEYASPNTNKPLHLGHIRNILLGDSVSKILQAAGYKTYNTQIINDRGIHICKSMVAWKNYGQNQTPENSGIKGDKLVGNYYVTFDKIYKSQIEELVNAGVSEEKAKKQAPIFTEAQEMLLKWEAQDAETMELWRKMNQWVYNGFDKTFESLGVTFDSLYYESNTYLLGKDVVEEGLSKGVFYKKPDGSVWIDLTSDGLDEKLVLRADGTSVYMTQDLGTAIQRVKDFPDIQGMVYTVGNEQDYHFKVLFLILKKLGYHWAEHLYHLSYGMVDLPSGKMKSREGTVVDADDLIQEMVQTAQNISEELGKLDGLNQQEKQKLYHTIGLGALKYYILKVDPKKRILFNPKESVDFNGNTGPFIQYTYARIQSILRKADFDIQSKVILSQLHPKEKELIKVLSQFEEIVSLAASNYSPALIANYLYDLVKEYNSFYQEVSILGELNLEIKTFRVQLSRKIGLTIKNAFYLLGISAPERM